jgi:hypothetical protein
VTVAAVRAVVEQDRPAMEAMKAYEHGDPYEFTREYRRWGDVHLVMPPGDPRTWVINVTRGDDDGWVARSRDVDARGRSLRPHARTRARTSSGRSAARRVAQPPRDVAAIRNVTPNPARYERDLVRPCASRTSPRFQPTVFAADPAAVAATRRRGTRVRTGCRVRGRSRAPCPARSGRTARRRPRDRARRRRRGARARRRTARSRRGR